ncbi:MAG: long-chain-fatty-acid--CoA ligase [Acidobacteriia bacterium]|nr:long-chain-fatty-acid--CoA ligase [Terriglobia bacterium]
MNVPLTPVRFLRYAQEQVPDHMAVVCGEERFTYAQFGDRAARLAGALRESGVKAGDRVAFLSPNCHRLLEAYYGVLEAGAVLLPLNIRLAPHELAYILNDAGATVLFLDQAFLPLVDSFRKNVPTVRSFFLLNGKPHASWLSSQNYEDLLASAQPYFANIMQFDENALAELFYTSGTSASPKGVMLTHRNVYLHALDVAVGFTVPADTVHLHTIPLFHANGWGAAHFITVMGGKHVMIRSFDPVEVLRLIAQERVQSCFVVPIMAQGLIHAPQRPEYDLSSLKWMAIGGSASSPTLVREVKEKLGCDCFSGYGMTETAPVLAISRQRAGGVPWKGQEHYERQAMTGYALPGVEMRVVDATDTDVPRDGRTIGEIITRADGVMEGYWKQEQTTADVMRGGWLHTGDMATVDAHGYTLIVDRKKDIIISGGENISSLELEKTLAAHPSVYDAAVIPVPDEKWGEVPKAFVVLKPGEQATELELLEFCRAHMAHYKAPRSVEFVSALPKNATGKTLKRDLRKKYWSERGAREELATQS